MTTSLQLATLWMQNRLFRNSISIAEIVLLFEVLIVSEIETIMRANNEQSQKINRAFELDRKSVV